jgi:ribosomal protein S12 methylthiotransferase
VRLHYVYPYPHVDRLIPLMADGLILPYLDMPLQHASPAVLKAMRRPAATEKVLERLAAGASICPELVMRSTFIVGFPGETEADFEELLAFLDEAQLDRVGCFPTRRSTGAAANACRTRSRRRSSRSARPASCAQRRLRPVGRAARALTP